MTWVHKLVLAAFLVSTLLIANSPVPAQDAKKGASAQGDLVECKCRRYCRGPERLARFGPVEGATVETCLRTCANRFGHACSGWFKRGEEPK
jgi:hypothetical protein